MPSPTDAVVDRCVAAADADRPPAVQDRLKQHLLDTLGVAVGGRTVAASSPAFERAVGALAGGGDEATVLATGERYPAADAALLNGAFAHSLDFDDTHRESSLHPGAPVISAALAVAEREGADAETLLAALDAGYDVACAVGRAINPDAHYAQGFHITATCGTFGATAAAGVVAGLDREEFENAFGLNGSQVAGSLQFLDNGAWNKRLHPGFAARRAVEAVTLAAAGVRGASAPIEGDHGFFAGYTTDPNPSALDDLGERHAVLRTALKPYPCCRYMHPALDALVDLAGTIDPDAVESITVDLPRPGVTLTGDPIERKRRPSNFVDCQFSMPFGAALALTTGEAGLTAFVDAQDRLDAAPMRRLMDATDVVTTDEVASLFPDQWAARIVVETGSDRHERFVETASGEPERPLGWDGVVEKFRGLADVAAVPSDARSDLVDAVRHLDERGFPALVDALEGTRAATAPAAGD